MTSIAAVQPIALRNDRRVLLLPVVLIGAFASLTLCPRVSANANLMGVFIAITAIFTVLYGLVLAMVASGRRLPTYSVLFRPSHYVQALVHSSIYAYWGWYWRPVYHEAILILAQIIFVYVLDCLIAWLRGRNWQLGFGPFPIIFSTNLFLWFKDDWYAWQFVMVAVGLFGKMLITWNRDGRRTHIFNPSALSLSIASTILIFSGSTGVSWGNEIANTLTYPHYIYVWIFLVGLIVQYLFNVTLVTLSAAVSLLLLGAAWYAMTGNGFPAALYTVFKIMWYRDHEPEMFGRVRTILGTKDYINYRLTGKIATDYSYASGSGVYDLRGWKYADDLIQASGVPRAMLPEIIPSSEVSGGARVRVVGDNLEFDLTDEAISKLLLKHLLPRYRGILEGTG